MYIWNCLSPSSLATQSETSNGNFDICMALMLSAMATCTARTHSAMKLHHNMLMGWQRHVVWDILDPASLWLGLGTYSCPERQSIMVTGHVVLKVDLSLNIWGCASRQCNKVAWLREQRPVCLYRLPIWMLLDILADHVSPAESVCYACGFIAECFVTNPKATGNT